MSSKKIIDFVDFNVCPKCGKQAEWVGSEVDEESYLDEYVCECCNTRYTIVFDMAYVCHLIDNE